MDSPTVKRFLPWVVATALFMEQLDSTIVNTAVPSMAASLHVTPLSLKAVAASYILSLAVCIPVSGWIADPADLDLEDAVRTFPVDYSADEMPDLA
jgi:MFS family permease